MIEADATTELGEGEFYNLLWNEMDRFYASTAVIQIPTDPQPERSEPEVD